jgi:hypothetical protein
MDGIKIEVSCPYGDCKHIDDVRWDPNAPGGSNWEHECGGCRGVYEIDIEYSISIECKKLVEDDPEPYTPPPPKRRFPNGGDPSKPCTAPGYCGHSGACPNCTARSMVA